MVSDHHRGVSFTIKQTTAFEAKHTIIEELYECGILKGKDPVLCQVDVIK